MEACTNCLTRQPDGKNIHAARKRNDRVVRNADNDLPQAANVQQPYPERGNSEQLRDWQHGMVETNYSWLDVFCAVPSLAASPGLNSGVSSMAKTGAQR